MRNKQAIIRLFIANTISGFAQGLSMLAIPWYFVDILEQPVLWGSIYLAVNAISLFWGLYAGTLVDRFNRKNIFLAETSIGTIWLLSIAAFGFYFGHVPIFLAGLVFATTFFTYNIHYPALYAFVQEITDKEHYSRITSYLEIQGQITNVTAGGLGAILLAGIQSGEQSLLGWQFNIPFSIEAWSLHEVFLLDGCTYLLSFFLIFPIHYQAVAIRKKEKSHLVKRFKVGVQFLKENSLVFIFGNAAYFVFVVTMLLNFVLMPNFVKSYLHAGAGVFALSDMAFSLGAVFSGLSIAYFFRNASRVLGSIIMTCVTATCLFVLVFYRGEMGFYLIMVFFGLANSGSRIMRVTYMFTHVPNQVLGRVQSIFQIINVLLRMAFIAICSSVFFIENIHYSFGLLGACCLVAAAILTYYYKDLVNLKIKEQSKTSLPS
ncbi:MAG: MFS transporter [Chitinophagales bacterium]